MEYQTWKFQNRDKIQKKMTILVDIDETIARTPANRDYTNSLPIMEMIQKVNRLHDMGHEIIYYSARGTSTGVDWFPETYIQLVNWGCKFFGLRLGKPMCNFIVDDRALRPNEIDWLVDVSQEMLAKDLNAEIE